MARIVIVGGGISGLALAYRLEQRLPTAEVVVLENQGRVGGNVETLARDGFRVEAGPNGFLDNKPATLALCQDLGLGKRLIPASGSSARNRFLFLRERMRLLPSSLTSFLCSDVVSWWAKYRILTERWRSRRRDLSDESIADFVTRRVGREVANSLADAFVTGIFAGDPTRLSVQATLPRLAAMERDHGSLLRGMAVGRKQRRLEAKQRGEAAPPRQQMWSFEEGLGVLVDRLREALRTPPVTGVAVRRIRRAESWQIEAEGRDAWNADAVVLTCPAYQQANILADLDETLALKVSEIAYNRVAVVALGYRAVDVKHRLDGFGYLTPQRDRRDVLGVQWCSSIFPGRAPEGLVLLRALCGGWNRPDILDWDEPRLLQAVRDELAQTMGVQGEPVFHQIVRWPRAIPQYHLGHLDRVAWIDKRCQQHAGLYLGGNAYRGVALNDCVEQSNLLAESLARHLGSSAEITPIPSMPKSADPP
jgi:oxygen-dependent protoporphyrinogen oxidase